MEPQHAPLYEGKAKTIYRLDDGQLLQVFKDQATAFNGQKREIVEGKGVINARLTALLMAHLEESGVATHFMGEGTRPGELLTKELKMIPLEVVVRNQVAGSLAKRLQVPEGKPINPPLVEWFLKDDEKQDPQVSVGILQGLFGYELHQLEAIEKMALKINQILVSLFEKAHLELIDFKLEFGVDKDGVLTLGDEVTPDTCRLWDQETKEKLDKDRFRFELGDLMTGYQEIEKRLKEVL